MSLSLRCLVIAAVAAGWLAPASPAKEPFTVVDAAELFSKGEVEKANERIAQIKRESGKDVLVETIAAVPDADRTKVEKKEDRENYFRRQAEQRYRDRGVDGVYVLISKSPPFVEVYSAVKGYDRADRQALVKAMTERLREREFDEALRTAVDRAGDALESSPKKPAEKPRHGDTGQTQHREGTVVGWGSLIGTWLCLALVVGLAIWLVIALIRAFSGGGGGGGGGYGGGGYGGGGSGGGGFFSSMLGGMFGAAAGMWIYDSFFRSTPQPTDYGGTTPGGTTPADTTPADAGGEGGDWGASGGKESPDASGGDWGDDSGSGGADDSGGSGGDWGGGDFGGGDVGGGDDGGGGGDGGGDW